MNKLIITKEALQSIENSAIYPFRSDSIRINDNYYIIDIDDDVLEFIQAKGIDTNDIDQVSDFIMSYAAKKN